MKSGIRPGTEKAVKPRLLGVFIANCTLGIILMGYLFNAIQFLLI